MMAAGLPTYDCYSFVLTIALFSLGEFPSDRSYPPARFPPPLRCLHYSPQADGMSGGELYVLAGLVFPIGDTG